MAVWIEMEGREELARVIGAAMAVATPDGLTRLAKNFAAIMLREEAGYFATETGPDGVPWPNLSDWTLEARRKGGEGAKKLQDKGHLRISVTPSRGGAAEGPGLGKAAQGVDPPSRDAIRRYGPWGFDIGTNLAYGRTHQFGRGPIKARVGPFVRRQRSRDTRAGRGRGHSIGVAYVRGHERTFPAIPRRKFLGFNDRGVARMEAFFGSNLWRPD